MRVVRVLIAVVAGVFLPISLAAGEGAPVRPGDVQGPLELGRTPHVHRLGRLWLAGQPDERALALASERGISVVVDLRDPAERDWDERRVAEAAGLAYYNVPVPGGEPFSEAAFGRIDAILASHPEAEVLVHCASGNRVGGWLAAHLAEKDGMDPDAALAVARRAGITKPAIEEKARAYLASHPRPDAPARP